MWQRQLHSSSQLFMLAERARTRNATTPPHLSVPRHQQLLAHQRYAIKPAHKGGPSCVSMPDWGRRQCSSTARLCSSLPAHCRAAAHQAMPPIHFRVAPVAGANNRTTQPYPGRPSASLPFEPGVNKCARLAAPAMSEVAAPHLQPLSSRRLQPPGSHSQVSGYASRCSHRQQQLQSLQWSAGQRQWVQPGTSRQTASVGSHSSTGWQHNTSARTG